MEVKVGKMFKYKNHAFNVSLQRTYLSIYGFLSVKISKKVGINLGFSFKGCSTHRKSNLLNRKRGLALVNVCDSQIVAELVNSEGLLVPGTCQSLLIFRQKFELK